MYMKTNGVIVLTAALVWAGLIVNVQGMWEKIDCDGEPTARHENAFVEVNGKFYLLGGRGIKPVDIFDPVSREWSEGARSPIELHHFQAVEHQGKIYAFMGMIGRADGERPLSHIWIYDPAEDRWEEGDEIPEDRRRSSAGVVVDGDKAIIISGIIDGHRGNHVKWVDQYDFITGEWSVLADAPRARDHFHAAMKDGKIYCAGGRNSSRATGQTFELTRPEVDVYDIDSDSWESFPESHDLPTPRAGTSTVIADNHLIVIGGESGLIATAHDEVEAYDLESDEWRTLAPLARGRHGTQAIVHDDNIYIVAGSGNRGGRPELSSIERFEYNLRRP